jgi:hypothetical protein
MRAILSTLLVASCTFAFAGEELLKNPGFNEDADGNGLPDHWSTTQDRILWREKVFMGKDYEVVSKSSAYVLATQDIALEKGQQYTITLRCKGAEGGLVGALIVHGETRPVQEMPIIWNVEPATEYEEIVRTFIAPNPVARLYIYNVAKAKGTVYYDHVSLRGGPPDRAIITQLTFNEIDRPLTPPVEHRHIDWASPLAGGPVKTFATIRNFRCTRQFIELSQRMDLDCDLVHTGYYGDEAASVTGRRAMQRMKDGFYEVYLVPSRVSDMMVQSIKERVEMGAGLVIIEGFGRARRFVDLNTLEEVGDDHYLRACIPWDLMPEKILESVQVGRQGKGRVVRMVFPLDTSRVWGLMPLESSREAWMSRQFEYWEWWESLLAKGVLWAAGREGQTRLELLDSDASAIRLRAAGAPAGAKARVIVRSGREIRFDGPLVRMDSQIVVVGDDGSIDVTVPWHIPAGPVIADVVLLDPQGQTLTWGSFATTKPQTAKVVEVMASSDNVEPDQTIGLSVTIQAARACPASIEAKLIDVFGRVVDVTTQDEQLGAGARDVALTLAMRRPLCVHHKAFVRVTVDGLEQDSRWITVLCPSVGPARAMQDFTAMPWGPGMSHPVVESYYAQRVREIGLNGEFGGTPFTVSEHGFPGGGYVGGMAAYRETEHSPSGVRRRCLSDPEIIEQVRTSAAESAEKQQPFGIFAVGITDEAFLSSRHKRHETCFGPHCQARYRQWLRARYGTLAALNAQWGTSHGTWDDVQGARTEDVRKKDNFGPFVDFRTFMTDVWVDGCKRVVDAYHEVSPNMPIGHTNTFGAGPFNGNDYWKLCTRTGFAWGQEYSEAIKHTGHKAVFDLWRSFVDTPQARASRSRPDDPFFNYGWIGYRHTRAAAHYEPWWLALHGSRGVSYYATNAIAADRGISWALVYPTLSLTEFSSAVQEGLADLRGGCGKVFMEYEREQPKIALLWSHPSMMVAWCESESDQPVPEERDGTDSYGSYFRSALHFRQYVNELQLDYAYVAPEQVIESNELAKYPMLFLPFTVAASDELIAKLEAYVESGGLLVGDLRCLRTDEHGKPFADPAPLERLFGVRRKSGQIDYGRTKLTFSLADEGIDLAQASIELHGREDLSATSATSLASHATGEPAVLIDRKGKGLTVYLNFGLPAYDVNVRELLRQIAAHADIERLVVAENPAGGDPPRCYERNTFARGTIKVHAFIRDHRRCEDTDPVRFDFGEFSHVYDMRAKRYIGNVSSVETVVPPGETALYAGLPYRVTSLSVSAARSAKAGGELRIGAQLEADAEAIGDHVFHLDLIGPGGESTWHYARNELSPSGRLASVVPLAVNENPGTWTVRVRDVLTGVTGEAKVSITVP